MVFAANIYLVVDYDLFVESALKNGYQEVHEKKKDF